jgi:hypothetical protein
MMRCFAIVVASCFGWTSEEVGVAFVGSMVAGYTVASFALNSKPSKVLMMMCDWLSSPGSALFSSYLSQTASCEVMFCIHMTNALCWGHARNTQIEVVDLCLNFGLCFPLQPKMPFSNFSLKHCSHYFWCKSLTSPKVLDCSGPIFPFWLRLCLILYIVVLINFLLFSFVWFGIFLHYVKQLLLCFGFSLDTLHKVLLWVHRLLHQLQLGLLRVVL